MKEYIYKGPNAFKYRELLIALPDDVLQIENNKIYNTSTMRTFNYMNEQVMEDLLTDCYLLADWGTIKESDKDASQRKDIADFSTITKTMLETFIAKNQDYGNSFELSLNEEGLTASRIRMGDKWNRFKNLSKSQDIKVKDESIRDTLLDMASYCIMTVMWLDKQE